MIPAQSCNGLMSINTSGRASRKFIAGSTSVVDAQWLFVFIGALPRTDWLGAAVRRDSKGFVLTGPDLLDDEQRPPEGWPLARDPYLLESSVPGIFVAGDVRGDHDIGRVPQCGVDRQRLRRVNVENRAA